MSRSANPITTAVRSWALRSPARLALGVLIVLALLLTGRGLITAATGHSDAPAGTAATATSATSTPTPTPPVPIDEVTETQVAAMSAASVISTPARAAMFYAHAFLDTTAAPTEWALTLARVADPTDIDDRLTAARPTAPESILGPTRTTEGSGDAGTRVDIDTSAGLLTATLTDTGHGWRIDTPLPTVNLDTLPTPGPTPSTTLRTASPTTSSAPSVGSAPSTTTQTPGPLFPAPTPPPAPTPSPVPVPVPVPVPGPIPLPDLNTPLPGPLT